MIIKIFFPSMEVAKVHKKRNKNSKSNGFIIHKPIGIKTIENSPQGTYILQYKKMGGCIKYHKTFSNPHKLIKCVHVLERRKYTYQIYEEIDLN